MWRSVHDARAGGSRNRVRNRGCSGEQAVGVSAIALWAAPGTGGRRRDSLLDHPAWVSASSELDARLVVLFYRRVHRRELSRSFHSISIGNCGNGLSGSRVFDSRSHFRLPIRLHPDPQGSLSRARAHYDDLPAIRPSLSRLRTLLHPPPEWSTWTHLHDARHRHRQVPFLSGSSSLFDGGFHIPLHGDEHRCGAV